MFNIEEFRKKAVSREDYLKNESRNRLRNRRRTLINRLYSFIEWRPFWEDCFIGVYFDEDTLVEDYLEEDEAKFLERYFRLYDKNMEVRYEMKKGYRKRFQHFVRYKVSKK